MVKDGGKVCLDGRNSESHPYGCFLRNSRQVMNLTDFMDKSVTIQGWLSMAHISCKFLFGLAFRSARNGILRLTLSNLVFHNNGVNLLKVGCSHVVVSNCRFLNCQAAVGIRQQDSRSCRESSLIITDSEFLYNEISVFVWVFNEFFTVKISRCVFQGKVGRFHVISEDRRYNASVYIKSTTLRHRVHVHGFIADSIFKELAHAYNGFALSFKVQDLFSTGNLSLLNTTFINNENSLFAYGGFDVQLTMVTIKCTYGHAITASGPPKLRATIVGLKLNLNQCILENNRMGIIMGSNPCLHDIFHCSTSEQSLVVKNSLIYGGNETQGNGIAINFQVKTRGSTIRPSFFKAVVLILENVTFQGLHNRALYVAIQKNVQGLIVVKKCTFFNNSQFVYRLASRSTVEIQFEDEDPPKSCQKLRNHGRKFIWKNSSQIPVIFEDSTFEGNVGISAALNFLNGNVTFKNCAFKDNEGLTVGGHVYMKTGYGRLNIENSTFLQTRLNGVSNGKQRRISSNGCFLHSDSAGPVVISNTSFTANVNSKFTPILAATKTSLVQVDDRSTLRCPSGKRVKMDKMTKTEGFEFTKGSQNTCWMKVNYIKLFCEECPDEFYSLQRGLTTGLDINKDTACLECPYGALCEGGNIKAKENFWGLNISTNPPSLQFFPCPLEYCSSPEYSSYYTYNACFGKRSGVLCGKCSDGYSEALYSTSCRKKEKCNEHWFWLATVIYVNFFAVYFVFKPPIFSVLYRQTLWFKKTCNDDACVQTLHQEDDKEHDPGYLKIIFYFYQVAELVMIKSPEKALHMVPFIPSVTAVFNFQVKTIYGSVDCPFPGLNVVTKELFLCLKFLATLLSIGFIYALHRAASSSRYISSPRMTLYLAVALETLLLGYERLADTTLKLMHCVPTGMDWRLFVDGNIQCWQWWQYLLIVFMMVFIIPLIFVLFWGSLMLAKDKMSAKGFLIACAFPLPSLLKWIVRGYKKTEDDDVSFIGNLNDSKEIKKVLHEPFRGPSGDDCGTMYWESVLTGRRLILLAIHTFATDPMVKFLCLDCACVLILVHHLSLRPFRDRKANIFESLSLMSLLIICTFSLAEATYFSEGIEPTGPSESLFHTLQWIEIGVLGLAPVVVGILVVFTLLSQVVRLLYYCVKLLSYVVRCKFLNRVNSLGHLSLSRQLLLDWDTEELQTVT